MGFTHLVIGSMGTSIIMGTTDAGLLLVGAAATLLPDVDTSTSIAGRALFPISRELERRFPHRSCTHSLVASGIVAILFYPLALASYVPINLIHALNIGYFLGYFADIFTAAGCELFWPSTVRAVWPGNRNYRLRTNSPVEYGVLVVLSFLLALSIAINSNGGILTQFNRLIASTEGVEQIYNQSGATHLITVRIQGVFRKGRSRVTGNSSSSIPTVRGFSYYLLMANFIKQAKKQTARLLPSRLQLMWVKLPWLVLKL